MLGAYPIDYRAPRGPAAHPFGAVPCGCAGTGALEMPVLDWKQIGVGLIVGVGLGYVFFATK
jgi:hypothetical protein